MAPSEKQREYFRRWKQNIRDEFVRSRGGACERCGAEPGEYGLIVDYADLSTKTQWAAKIWSMGRERREAELEKCVVLCRECHQEHTLPPHGTLERARLWAKTGKRCPCRACRDARNAYQHAWLAQRGEFVSRRVGPRMLDEPWREELRTYPTEPPQTSSEGWWNDLGRDDTLAPAPTEMSLPNDTTAP